MAYKSGNPALNKNTFTNVAAVDGETMTLDGVSTKSLTMLTLAVVTGLLGWRMAERESEMLGALLVGAITLGLGIAIATVIKKRWAPVTAPVYALVEGFILGAISQLFERSYEGIVLQALLLTGGIFTAMLLIYRLRLIRATENFKLGVAAATGGIFLFYLANFVMGFFGREAPLINSTSGWGIGFTMAVIVLAALNLVVDFDFIEQGVEKRAPKYMEWYASFGLFVTVVWLYIELLRLLAKLRDR